MSSRILYSSGRIVFVQFILLIGFCALLGRLVYLQIYQDVFLDDQVFTRLDSQYSLLAPRGKILDRNDNIYLPTHGTQIDNPHDLVNKYIEHRINREEQIIKAIKSGNFKINEMVKIIYSDVDPGLHPAASMSTLAHLNRMIKNKIIKVNGKGLKANYNII